VTCWRAAGTFIIHVCHCTVARIRDNDPRSLPNLEHQNITVDPRCHVELSRLRIQHHRRRPFQVVQQHAFRGVKNLEPTRGLRQLVRAAVRLMGLAEYLYLGRLG
jgi:hypothetical protein